MVGRAPSPLPVPAVAAAATATAAGNSVTACFSWSKQDIYVATTTSTTAVQQGDCCARDYDYVAPFAAVGTDGPTAGPACRGGVAAGAAAASTAGATGAGSGGDRQVMVGDCSWGGGLVRRTAAVADDNDADDDRGLSTGAGSDIIMM